MELFFKMFVIVVLFDSLIDLVVIIVIGEIVFKFICLICEFVI